MGDLGEAGVFVGFVVTAFFATRPIGGFLADLWIARQVWKAHKQNRPKAN